MSDTFMCLARAIVLAVGLALTLAAAPALAQVIDGTNSGPQVIAKYQPRFGRTEPVIAVLASHPNTELTDFVIPFGILSASKIAEVVVVATRSGTVRMRPALHLQIRTTVADFDRYHSDGADYVIVPAMIDNEDPVVPQWIRAQAAKGATIVSICDGAEVVAATGLMDGHRATAHWASEQERVDAYPKVRWVKNIRYVADGRLVSSAGISASIPVSIALVEAIAGHDRAAAVAQEFGVAGWSSRHNSDAFQLSPGEQRPPPRERKSPREAIGIPVAAGIDEVALALTAEVYSHMGKARVVAVSASDGPVETKHGLLLTPEIARSDDGTPNLTMTVIPKGPPTQVLDKALAVVAAEYGRSAAHAAARIMEYPGFRD